MRAQNDLSYSMYLLNVGNGDECVAGTDNIDIPLEMLIEFEDEDVFLNKLIQAVYPDLQLWVSDSYAYVGRVILAPKNESVDHVNDLLIDGFPGQIQTYYSYDEAIDNTEKSFDIDFLNTLSMNGVPPHELKLKKNCPIILLRNLNSAEGLSNGTRLICRHFQPNLIEAEISVGQQKGKLVLLPRIPFIPTESAQTPFSFKRTQFPVRLCFAMTINKSQGQTLDFVGLYLRQPVFTHGQLYVALSRVKSKDTIKVLLCPSIPELLSYQSKNIVFREILDMTMNA